MSELKTHYTICGVKDVLGLLEREPFDAVLSIHHPGAEASNLQSPVIEQHGYTAPQLTQVYWDNDVEDFELVWTEEMGHEALGFLRAHRGKRILVHCRAGKARSAATALMGIADELGAGREEEAVQILDNIRGICTPNPLVVRIADRLLKRDGRLAAAVEMHEGIQARMPEWYAGKLRGMLHFHGEGVDAEKVLNWPAHYTEEQKAKIIADARSRAWKPEP